MSVDTELEFLTRGCVDVVTREGLRTKLARNNPLTVKVGFDPTAPDIHLGHTVLMRKMKHFQDHGHRVVFLIGDFTGMIGDPTGRSKTRPPLSRDEIVANAETYKKQAFKILDPRQTEIRFNSEWLGTLRAEDIMRLAATYNVARMLERRDFRQRYEARQSISVHEFLYPLAQAYDSVFLKADVELGGTDQLFNLNVGRDIMPDYGLEPQVVITTPLLEGLDGVEKMSKSLGNYVGVMETPETTFAKLMSISDSLMWRYYLLLTDLSEEGIAAERMKGDAKQSKKALAFRIVAGFHGEGEARQAQLTWELEREQRQIPASVEEQRPVGHFKAHELLVHLGLVGSKSEAVRLLRQQAVRVTHQGQSFVIGPHHEFSIPLGGLIEVIGPVPDVAILSQEIVISVGPRRHKRVRATS